MDVGAWIIPMLKTSQRIEKDRRFVPYVFKNEPNSFHRNLPLAYKKVKAR